MKVAVIFGAVAIAAAGAWYFLSVRSGGDAAADGKPIVQVQMPGLSGDAVIGAKVFEAKCSACHGPTAGGRNGFGPPLIHKIYEPSHRGDAAFYLAAENGVRSHHWPFGNMPPVDGVTPVQIAYVVAFVRAVQRANGIQ